MKIKYIANILFFLFCAALLFLSLRGLPGNPNTTQLLTETWRDNGPFELSPERGRFALLYAVLENKTFSFSRELAFFTAPDVAYMEGRFVSLFAPGLSFIVMPGYLVGKYFGASQLGTYAMVSIFALLNVLLIRVLATHLGAHPVAAMIAAFGFLFATPAYAYAVNLYQHHISTFLMLLCCYLLTRGYTAWSLSVIWLLCVFSVVIDYPNFFMFLPIGVFALSKLFSLSKTKDGSMTITFFSARVLTGISILLPILFFCWVNIMSYGKPFQLAGELERPVKINEDGTPVLATRELKKEKKTTTREIPSSGSEHGAIGFFVNRNVMNGFYTHFVSPDRGMLVYTPVMIFSLIGMIVIWKTKGRYFSLFIAIIGFNILLYSMWGDPYGGWAFGSRYLIPTYALLSLFVAFALTQFRKNSIFLSFFLVVLLYSLAVNTLGAITTSRNPPKVEIAQLEKLSGRKQEYTFLRNAEYLSLEGSKSFVFQTVASRYMSAWNYYSYLLSLLIVFAVFLVVTLRIVSTKNHSNKYEI